MGEAPAATSSARGWAALGAVYLLWGTYYVSIRVGVRQFPPFLLVGIEFEIAGVVLYLAARRFEPASRAGLTARQWRKAAIAGTLLLVGGDGLVSVGEQHVAASVASVLIATIPLWMVLGDLLRGRLRWGWPLLAGLAVGLGGAALTAGGTLHGTRLGGVVAVLGAGVAWAAGSLYWRDDPTPMPALGGSASQMVVGGGALLALAAVTGELGRFHPAALQPATLFAFGWLIVGCSIAGFTAYTYALAHAPAGPVAACQYVNTAITVVLGATLLGEAVTARLVVGCALIICSVVVLSRASAGRWRLPGDAGSSPGPAGDIAGQEA